MSLTTPTQTAPQLPPGVTVTHAPVLVNQLSRPTEYARPLRPYWVASLARGWDELQAGELMVAERPDGRRVLLTGNHRWAAKLLRQEYAYAFRCALYHGLSLAQEATIYLAQDRNKLRHTAADDFKAMLRQSDPVALGIQRVLDGLGLEVAPYGGAGYSKTRIRAVAGLLKAYETCGEGNLGLALKLIRDEWAAHLPRVAHVRKSAYSESSVVPLATFLKLYAGDEGRLEIPKLREALRRDQLDGYEGRYMRHRMAASNRPGAGIATLYGVLALIDLYNYGRRLENRLEETVAREAAQLNRFGQAKSNPPFQLAGHSGAAQAKHFIEQLDGLAPAPPQLAAVAAAEAR